MNAEIASIESKIERIIEQHESEWLVICGLKSAPYNEMLKILQMLRNEQLHELEAMMIWKMEYSECNKIKEKAKNQNKIILWRTDNPIGGMME